MIRSTSRFLLALGAASALLLSVGTSATLASRPSPDQFTSASCTFGTSTTTVSFTWKGHATPNAYTVHNPVNNGDWIASISAAQQSAKSVTDTLNAVDLYGSPGDTVTLQLWNTTKNQVLATTTTVCVTG